MKAELLEAAEPLAAPWLEAELLAAVEQLKEPSLEAARPAVGPIAAGESWMEHLLAAETTAAAEL